MARDPLNLLDLIVAKPWVVHPDWMAVVMDVARRRDVVETLQNRLGWSLEAIVRRLDDPAPGTRGATVRDGVGVLPLVGPVFPRANLMTDMSGATSLQSWILDLEQLGADDEIGTVVLDIDSPGGVVTDVAETADAVAELAETKRVIAVTSGMMASAAYWIGAAADEIVVGETAEVGSIGAVGGVVKQVQPDQRGEISFEVVSSNARNKRPDPQTEEGLAVIRARLDAVEAVFFRSIADDRGLSVEAIAALQGGVLMGADAVAAGLADRVGTLEQVLAELREQGRSPASVIVNSGQAAAAGSRAGQHQTMEVPTVDPKDEGKAGATTPTATKDDNAGAQASGVHISAIADEAENVREAFPQAAATIHNEGLAAGAQAERDRLADIDKVAAGHEKGNEALIATLKADPKATGDSAARALLEATRGRGANYLAGLKHDDASTAQLAAVPAAAEGVGAAQQQTGPGDDAPLEERIDHDWSASATLRAEFGGDKDSYAAYRRAVDAGKVRVLGDKRQAQR